MLGEPCSSSSSRFWAERGPSLMEGGEAAEGLGLLAIASSERKVWARARLAERERSLALCVVGLGA